MNIIQHPVPYYTKGHIRPVKFGVIHFVSCRYYEGWKDKPYDMEGILDLFDKLGTTAQFSCHYIISREGQIYQLVQLADTSWNAGKSVVAIPTYTEKLNDCSIGIELVGKEGDKYTTQQYQALAELAVFIEDEVQKMNIGSIEHWVGHDWVSGEIAVKLGVKEKSKMKKDPGVLFDWEIFNRERYRFRLETEIKVNAKSEFKKEILEDLSASKCFKLWMNKMFKRRK